MDFIFAPVEEWVREHVKEMIMGALEALRDVIVDLSYSVTLVGGGISILLWIGGWEKGKRWTGILFVVHVLIKLLLG